MNRRRRQPAWAKGKYVRLISAARLNLAMAEADQGQGVNGSELARAAGYKVHTYIAKMRKGDPRARTVTAEAATAIAKRLGVEREWLFEAVEVKSVDRTGAAA